MKKFLIILSLFTYSLSILTINITQVHQLILQYKQAKAKNDNAQLLNILTKLKNAFNERHDNVFVSTLQEEGITLESIENELKELSAKPAAHQQQSLAEADDVTIANWTQRINRLIDKLQEEPVQEVSNKEKLEQKRDKLLAELKQIEEQLKQFAPKVPVAPVAPAAPQAPEAPEAPKLNPKALREVERKVQAAEKEEESLLEQLRKGAKLRSTAEEIYKNKVKNLIKDFKALRDKPVYEQKKKDIDIIIATLEGLSNKNQKIDKKTLDTLSSILDNLSTVNRSKFNDLPYPKLKNKLLQNVEFGNAFIHSARIPTR